MALVHPHPARTCITIWVIWMAVKTFINPLLDSNQILWAPDGVGTSVPCLFMPKCLWNSLIKYFGDSFRLEESPDPVFYPWYQPPATCCTPARPILTCQEAKTPYIDPFYVPMVTRRFRQYPSVLFGFYDSKRGVPQVISPLIVIEWI